MARISAAERREALRKRTKRGANEVGQRGMGRKSVLDYSKAGDKKISKYEVKSGKEINYIDILPFEITQPWYKDLRSVSGSTIGLDIGFTDYKLEIPIHRSVGENNDVFLCLRLAFGKKCPICEEMYAEWDKAEEEQDAKKIQALKPSWRCFYNVYDYDGDGTSVQLWEDYSYFLFEEALQEALQTEDEGVATFSDLEMGSSIEFKGREKKLGKNPFVECHSIAFKKRDKYNDDILNQTFPLDAMLIIPNYEQVAKTHLGIEDEEMTTGTKMATGTEPEPSTQKERTRQRPDQNKSESKKNSSEPPWDKCPAGMEFGIDCDPSKEACENCEEDIFQACAAKQDLLEQEKNAANSDKSETRSRQRETTKTSSEPEAKTTSRRRRSGR